MDLPSLGGSTWSLVVVLQRAGQALGLSIRPPSRRTANATVAPVSPAARDLSRSRPLRTGGGIAGPRGGIWQAGTIRGQAQRDTGILQNLLYIGELVWNRRRWIKDPGTGGGARANPTSLIVTEQVPELRIVDQRLELLGELSAMLGAAGVEGVSANAKSPPTFPGGLDVFCGSVSLDAGTRKHLNLLLVT